MKNWYSIKNISETEATVEIYDEIGMWGITAKDFLNEIKAVGNRKIILRINSPGGEVFDGIAIYNRLREHKGGVEVRIDGIAASMASVIAMCGSPVKMAENALIMVHNPSGICMGGAEDMRDLADMLDKVKGALTGAYERKTGKSNEDIVKMMDEETWLDATEARALGFCDEITGANKLAANFGKLKLTGKLEVRKKEIDMQKVKATNATNQMADPIEPEPVTEPVVPVETPVEPAAPVVPVATTPVAQIIDSAKLIAQGAENERTRITEIKAWAKAVEGVQKVSLTDAVDKFIAEGKSLAEFKDHVITNTFKAQPLATASDHTLASGRTMPRAEFEKMSPFNQSDFCRKGGKITD